jgi:hypothetical protein
VPEPEAAGSRSGALPILPLTSCAAEGDAARGGGERRDADGSPLGPVSLRAVVEAVVVCAFAGPGSLGGPGAEWPACELDADVVRWALVAQEHRAAAASSDVVAKIGRFTRTSGGERRCL